ncbi:putative MFS family arabinose efflux permease [Geomicrobium halophilum]|uniref:Putative MFS family arabinose efflux permease n=1 Tax=Geomicrobium halophilum TaxID=549000 RepID=A0A841PQ58_9BACL|nr:MFS transporter [Geomicrobium halophilum]MBB6450900.1 putative MFS family arabinose efflux permease [Geomicrobium halophilum]
MKFSRLVLPGITMIAVTYGLARFSYGLLLPNISQDLEMSPSISGVISSLFYIAYCFAIIFSTLILTTDKGPRVMILAAGASAFIGLLIMGVSPNVWLLGLGVLFAGGSTGLVSPPYGGAISLWIEEKKQGKANTWINSGTSIGLALSGAGALVLASDWRLTYLIYAFIALLAFIWNAKVIPRIGSNPYVTFDKGKFSFKGVEGAIPLIICSTTLGISTAAFWTFSIDFIGSTSSYSDWQLSLFWIIIGLFGILGGFSGSLIERFGLPFAYKWASLVIGTASLFLAWLPEQWPVAYISAALFGISYIFITGVLMVWGIRVFITNASLGIGTPFLLLAVGQVIGSLFAGMFIDLVGFSFTFVTYGFMGMVAMILGPKEIKK